MTDSPTVMEVKTGEIDANSDRRYGEEVTWRRHKTLVGRNFEPHTPLENFRNLSNIKNLEMKVNIEDHLYDINLPSEMMVRLVRYLSNGAHRVWIIFI